jgi:hypothetical protein
MELGKYIRAMRPKKYLTREFKVYDASMADDNTIDTMSTDAPPMDNVMPYTDGLEDPRNRQLELADGGRAGFKLGTKPTNQEYTDRYIKGERKWSEGLRLSKEAKKRRDKIINAVIEKNINFDSGTPFRDLMKEVGYFKSQGLSGRLPVSLNTPEENVHNYFKTLIQDLDQPIENFKNIPDKISKKTGINKNYVSSLLQKLPEFKDLQRPLKYISLPAAAPNLKKGMLFSDIVERYDVNPVSSKGGTFRGYGGPEYKIMEFAKRHVDQGGKKVKIIGDPNAPLYETKFKYKGKIYDLDEIKRTGRTDKNFKNFYKTFDEKADLLSRQVIDPITKKPTTFGELMSKAYTKATGTQNINPDRVLQIDHAEGIKKDPFNNLRLLDYRTNLAQGQLKSLGKSAEAGALKNTAKYYTPENISKMNKKIGYSFIKDPEKFFKDQLKLADDILIKNRQLQQPISIAKKFIDNEEEIAKRMNTLISNIGCPTGTLKASEGANCYIKGVEKIKTNNLNQNEFNILRKAVNSPAAQTVLKYGKGALKILGPILTPLVVYDTFKSYKEGKPTFEILEEGLIGTGLARGIREAQTYTPEEREAIAQKKQYAREEQDYSGLSSDFNIPSNMSTDQIDSLSVTGPKRVEEKLAAEDAARAAERVYEGDPGFISETDYDVEERTGFKKGSKDKDSPVIPISPLTDLPQNESKRDFLKGIGAVGLGAVALGSGLLKLGKAAAPISEITKIVKGTTAPSWMDSLITKILKEGIELKSDPNSNVLIKKVKFKNPKTGVEEEATLTFDKQKNSYEIEYSSDETVGGKYGDKVFLKVEPEYAYDPQLQKMVPTGKHKFNAIEAEPEIVNPDGDIEMTGENVASKIIDLRSDISGLKSYVTGGKGIDKKIVKEKEALVKRAEEDPLADIEDNPRYSPRHYDLDEFSN